MNFRLHQARWKTKTMPSERQATYFSTKNPINKLAMNNRRLLIGAVFHYIQWKKTVKNITSWHKTLSASAVKVNNFQDAAEIFRMNSSVKFSRRVSCHQKVISFKLVFQFLTVSAETLHDNRTLFSQQSYVFGFLILTVFGAKMTS